MSLAAAAVRELLAGARVEKIYQPAPSTLVLHLYPRGGGYVLRLDASRRSTYFGLDSHPPTNPPAPSPFCSRLRKYLLGARLADVRQPAPRERELLLLFSSRPPSPDEEGNRHEVEPVIRILHAVFHPPSPGFELMDEEPQAAPPPWPSPPRASAIAEVLGGADPAASPSALARRLGGGLEPAAVSFLLSIEAGRLEHELLDLLATELGREHPDMLLVHPHLGCAACTVRGWNAIRDAASAAGWKAVPLQAPTELLRALETHVLERAREERRREYMQKAVSLVERTMLKLRHELEERLALDHEAEAARLYRIGELMKYELGRIPSGSTRAVLDDYESGARIEVPLDPALSPAANMERIFRRARKMRRAAEYNLTRIGELEETLELLERLRGEIPGEFQSAGEAELDALLDAVRGACGAAADKKEGKAGAGRRGGSARSGRKKDKPGLRLRSSDGFTLVVGRSAAENDEIYRRNLSGNDIWLHAKGLRGAHVVVKTRDGSCPERTIEEAALLAAHFSDGRYHDRVEVMVTEGRHLRKPPGSAPGMVVVKRWRNKVVRPDPAMARRLLVEATLGKRAGGAAARK